MGVLRDLIKQLGHKVAEEDLVDIERNAKAGQDDAEKIAKRMGQDRTSFVPHVDVSAPVEIPIDYEQEEHSKDDGARE